MNTQASEVFDVGDSVTWRGPMQERDLDHLKDHGPGPFKIAKIHFNTEREDHVPNSHPQSVTLEGFGTNRWFSGWWFKKIQ